ncbi:MAG: hypothetical protein ABFD69_15540 [Candidatus Sumerlaeia bacterium]
MTQVVCNRPDCMFHHEFVGKEGVALCRHADIIHHLKRHPCPLYRVDWQAMATKAQQLVKRTR